MALYTIHLFAGAGGGILADLLLGHTPVAACEIEEYPRKVLLQRQLDGVLPVFPIWDDITTLRRDNPECTDAFTAWQGIRENLIIAGGFPCQDISAAGRGEGIGGARSGLWKEMARVIGEILPRYVFVENSPLLKKRGLAVVLSDLAEMGYNAQWGVVGAHHAGAPHKRDRLWIVANASGAGAGDNSRTSGDAERNASREHVPPLRQDNRKDGPDRIDPASQSGDVAHSHSTGLERNERAGGLNQERWKDPFGPVTERRGVWWRGDPAEGPPESRMGRVADGVADRVERIKALGNGQVSSVAELAWKILK